MAIDALYLKALVGTIGLRRASAGARRLSALALAYPDLVVTHAALEEILGAETVAGLPVRPDADRIWAWHGLTGCKEPIYDSLAVFDRLGIDVEVIDVARARGMERIVDLNEMLPADLAARFDLVIDTGTCEHCFNVAMAFANSCDAVGQGGFLIHAAPLNRYNHGFWNFSPTVYPDYFEDNGFRVHMLTGVSGSLQNGFKTFDVQPFTRFDAPPGAALYVVAERIEIKARTWPVQRKYRGMIPAAAPESPATRVEATATPNSLETARARFKSKPGSVETALELGSALHDHGQHAEADLLMAQLTEVLRVVAADGRNPNGALMLESQIYRNFVKKVETEAHVRACFQSWIGTLAELGRRHRDTSLPEALRAPTADRRWRAGFVLLNGAMLGHTHAMIEVLAARPRAMPWHDRPVVYVLMGAPNPALDARLAELGVETCYLLPGGQPDFVSGFASMRRRIAAHGVTHLVWVSVPLGASFAFAARLAPAQIFWTLKFHPYRLPEIDGYITYGGWAERERIVHGERWDVVPLAIAAVSRAVGEDEVAAARAPFARYKVLLGSLARTEKINSAAFLDTVIRILQAHPDAAYLWTGRSRHEGIQARFESAGVADRCHFIGWVDTALYARVLDIFLETFPFGCGITGMQALDAGTAFLSFAAPETQYGLHFQRALEAGGDPAEDVRAVIAPPDGRAPLLYPADPAAYEALAHRLVTEPDFRRAVGEAGRDYFRRVLTDARGMAQRFFSVLEHCKAPEEGPG
jgi:glycosyltransferase involved in cell wall biosynthesis